MIRRWVPVLALLTIGLIGSTFPARAQSDFSIYLPFLTNERSLTTRATYVGGAEADTVQAVAFAADNSLLAAGTWPDLAPAGAATYSIDGGGSGALLRLDAFGDAIVSITRFSGPLRDLEVAGDGAVLVCGDFGLTVLEPTLDQSRWSAAPGTVSRCAIDTNGAVAALSGGTIYRYNSGGSGMISWNPAGSGVDDVAIDAASGLVFATGYTQKSRDLKVAYLRAYDSGGTLVWTNYDHSASAISAANLGADSEGRRIAIGRDGMLYFAGYTDGGNSIYQRDPRDITRRLSSTEQINIDNYSNTSNMSGAKSLAWFGRFNPADGNLLLGQWLLTRLSDGKGNSIGIKAISADEDGTVLLAGDAYFSLKNRTGMQFAGITLGSYEGGEPYFTVIAPDFSARRIWTALAAPGTSAGNSPLLGAAIRRGALVVGGTLNPRSSGTPRGMLTIDALQRTPASTTASEGYLLVMPTP